jgi:hypothetical protein
MRRVVTGNRSPRSTTPTRSPAPSGAHRSTHTPAGIIALAQLARLLAWIIRMIVRHPVAAGAAALLAFIWVSIGWVALVALVAWAVLVLAIWRWFWPSVFGRRVTAPVRGKWRAWPTGRSGCCGRSKFRQLTRPAMPGRL